MRRYFLVCLFASLLASKLALAGDITTNLAAWWKLDDATGSTAADSAGSKPLTWNGVPSWLTLTNCQTNGCAGFNGGLWIRNSATGAIIAGDSTVSIAMFVYYTTDTGFWGYTEGDNSLNRHFGVGTDAH